MSSPRRRSARAAGDRAPALLAWATLGCAALGAGCGTWLPEPPFGAHGPAERPILVPRPPPPPKVELIPPRPAEPPDTVWIDGEWVWRGRRWEWKVGRWELPPPDATYAPPEIVYLPEERIGWLPGEWHAVEEASER